MQVQEQQKKNACVKSLHTKQDSLHTRLCELQDSLDSMKGCLHNEKSKRCKDMFDEEYKSSMIGYLSLMRRQRLPRQRRK